MRYLAIFFLCIFLAAGYAAYDAYQFLNTPVEQPGSDIHFEVERGATFDRVVWDLKKAGLITDVKRFQLLGRYKKALSSIKAGEYILSTSLTPPQVLEQLLKGQAHLVRLTIREGLPWWETARAIEKQGFATYEDFKAVIHDPDFLARHAIPFDNAEGFLFPDTYLLNKPKKLDKEQAEYIASLLVQTFWKKNIPFWRLLEASPAPNDSFGAKVNDITSETSINSLEKLAEYSHLVVMRAPLPQADEFAIAYDDELLNEAPAEDDSSAENSTAHADKISGKLSGKLSGKPSDKPDDQPAEGTTTVGQAQEEATLPSPSGTAQDASQENKQQVEQKTDPATAQGKESNTDLQSRQPSQTSQTNKAPTDKKGNGKDTKAQEADNQQGLAKETTGNQGTDTQDTGKQNTGTPQKEASNPKDGARGMQGLRAPLGFLVGSAHASTSDEANPNSNSGTSSDTSSDTTATKRDSKPDANPDAKPDASVGTPTAASTTSPADNAGTNTSTSANVRANASANIRSAAESTAPKSAESKSSEAQELNDKDPQAPQPDNKDSGVLAPPKNSTPNIAQQKVKNPSKAAQTTAPLPAVWPAGALPSKMPKHPPQNPSEIDKDALRQALTLASLVEKETGLPTERPRVAGVYTNRIQKNMLLQCDPTIIYGIGPSFSGPIRRSHLKDTSNLYNTYIHPGLPPSPICSFGVDAFASALLPEQHGYFYFVATGLGKDHTFSKNLREHNRAVSVYRARMRNK